MLFNALQLSEYELTVAADIVDPLILPITWKDIGGLRETTDEIKVRMTLMCYHALSLHTFVVMNFKGRKPKVALKLYMYIIMGQKPCSLPSSPQKKYCVQITVYCRGRVQTFRRAVDTEKINKYV